MIPRFQIVQDQSKTGGSCWDVCPLERRTNSGGFRGAGVLDWNWVLSANAELVSLRGGLGGTCPAGGLCCPMATPKVVVVKIAMASDDRSRFACI
jgi:hypothetical protein